MRRRLSYLLLLLLLPLASPAQTHGFLGNSYVSASVGPSLYFSTHGTCFGGGASLSLGKWILNTTGMRAQFSTQYVSVESAAQLYYYGHCDIFFDLFTAIRGRNPSDVLRTYLLVGVGLVHTSSGDNDFCGTAGIGAEWRISPNWRLSLEWESFVHPSDFDNNNRSSLLSTLQLGAVCDINSNPTRSRSRFETRQFTNDWFFQLALGVSSFNHNGIGDFSHRLSLLTPIFEFGLGKRLTSLWLIRFNMSGLYTRSVDELFSYYNIRGDAMLDVVALFNPNHVNSAFTLRPYVSAGIVTRLDDQSHFLFSPAGGLQFSYHPDKRNEIFLDMRYLITPPRFAHVEASQGTLSVGLATLTVGYGYTFSRMSFK